MEQDALAACCEHHNFALFQARRGHYEEARRSLVKALNEVSWNAESHALMGKVLMALGQDDDARYHLKRALATDPSNSTATRMLSRISGDGSPIERLLGDIAARMNMSPAWVGSFFVVIVLAVIAIVALLTNL